MLTIVHPLTPAQHQIDVVMIGPERRTPSGRPINADRASRHKRSLARLAQLHPARKTPRFTDHREPSFTVLINDLLGGVRVIRVQEEPVMLADCASDHVRRSVERGRGLGN